MTAPERREAGSHGREAPGQSSDIETRGQWITEDERPLLGWLSAPGPRLSSSGILILPPVGYPYWSSQRTLRVLAERLAAAGHLALRIDYESTGDSAGDQWETDRVAAWRSSTRAAAEELRRLGCRRLVIVGAQLGGAFALLEAKDLGADAVVAWAPVVSGRAFAREIRLLSTEVPDDVLPPVLPAAMVWAGTVFSAETLAALSLLDAQLLPAAPAARVLIVDQGQRTDLAGHLSALGSQVAECRLSGGESALKGPTEYATVPEQIVEAICTFAGPGDPGERKLPSRPSAARIAWDGSAVNEQIVELGPERLVGIMTEPAEPQARTVRPATVVFLNSGSEAHVGPGRAWVEYGRALALLGHRCLRVDFRGWGESPDDGRSPGRPYDAHGEQDTIAIVRALRELGHQRIVLVGLCASAWIALQAVLSEPVAGVIALNPQLYWARGDPVEATMKETRLRRTDARRREHLGGRLGLWNLLDGAGARPRAARWLDQLRAIDAPVVLVFAEGDDGIEYLRDRLDRRLRVVLRSGRIRIVEVPEIDHSMHRTWLRSSFVELLDRELETIPS